AAGAALRLFWRAAIIGFKMFSFPSGGDRFVPISPRSIYLERVNLCKKALREVERDRAVHFFFAKLFEQVTETTAQVFFSLRRLVHE
ncbi:MAG: hypothetical protein AAB967_01480, partial [Patescibacteria group bacterium]